MHKSKRHLLKFRQPNQSFAFEYSFVFWYRAYEPEISHDVKFDRQFANLLCQRRDQIWLIQENGICSENSEIEH